MKARKWTTVSYSKQRIALKFQEMKKTYKNSQFLALTEIPVTRISCKDYIANL